MRSFPLIHSSLSETEQEFMRFVEGRADGRDALYLADGDSSFPGDTVRMRMSTTDTPDVSESRHTVEFMSLTGEGRWARVACMGHSMKEIEALQGRYVEIESKFEVVGPGAPDGDFPFTEVERLVKTQLDKMKAARLLPSPSTGRRAA